MKQGKWPDHLEFMNYEYTVRFNMYKQIILFTHHHDSSSFVKIALNFSQEIFDNAQGIN